MSIKEVKDKKIGLLKLDHNGAIIYLRKEDTNTNTLKKHRHTDDWEIIGKVRNRSAGKKKADEHQFFKKVVKEILDFNFLLIASHGKGVPIKGSI